MRRARLSVYAKPRRFNLCLSLHAVLAGHKLYRGSQDSRGFSTPLLPQEVMQVQYVSVIPSLQIPGVQQCVCQEQEGAWPNHFLARKDTADFLSAFLSLNN